MNEWKRDLARANRYMPRIRSILGYVMITEAPLTVDQRDNTDVVLVTKDARIACRVRDARYRHAEDFTIRFKRRGGNATEIDKVKSGLGDFIFYSYENESRDDLAWWFVGDTGVFRSWWAETPRVPFVARKYECVNCSKTDAHGVIRLPVGTRCMKNEDGGSCFLVVKNESMPDEFFVMTRDTVPRSAQRILWAETT